MIFEYSFMGIKYLIEGLLLCLTLALTDHGFCRKSICVTICALPMIFFGAIIQDFLHYLNKNALLEIRFDLRYFVFHVILCMLFCKLFLKKKKWMSCLALIVSILVIDLFCQFSGTTVTYFHTDIQEVAQFQAGEQLFSSAIILLLLIPSLCFAAHCMRGLFECSEKESAVILSFYLVLLVISNLLETKYFAVIALPQMSTVVYISFLFVTLFFLKLATDSLRERQSHVEQARLNQQYALQLLHTQEVEQVYGKLRELRHELKNQQLYLTHLLENREYEKLQNYFEERERILDPFLQMYDSGNALVNSILQAKMGYAQSLKIAVFVDVAVPESLQIKEHHLCSILVNLLDNAIESSEKCALPEIRVQIQQRRNYLFCCISNRIDTDVIQENPSLRTTKKDAENHGFGIRSVRLICQEYDGIFDIQVENGFFNAIVMLKN